MALRSRRDSTSVIAKIVDVAANVAAQAVTAVLLAAPVAQAVAGQCVVPNQVVPEVVLLPSLRMYAYEKGYNTLFI